MPPAFSDDKIPAGPAPERRHAPRHEPKECRAWLGWRDGPEYQVALAVLLDIGPSGAALVATRPLPGGHEVLMRLEPDPVATEAVEATVAGVESLSPELLWRVRLAFRGPCPPSLLRAALDGGVAYLATLN